VSAATAHDLAWPDLVWSHFSRPRHDDLDARIAAAAEAGYAAIGLFTPEFGRLCDEDGWDTLRLRRSLGDAGIVLAELEALDGWWITEADAERDPKLAVVRARSQRTEGLAYELADEVGARYLQVIGPYTCTDEQAVDMFGQLCDRAGAHGLLVGIEWLPFTNIRTARDAQRIVDAAGRANGGYCADIWHHERGARDLDMLRALPGERVFAIQMSDGSRRPTLDDYKADCLAHRVPPGEGEFDVVGFLAVLREIGVRAPLSIEVCSTELWAAPARDVAVASAAAMRAMLARLDEGG
jgi:sugar phosphate isomerase/epimerase